MTNHLWHRSGIGCCLIAALGLLFTAAAEGAKKQPGPQPGAKIQFKLKTTGGQTVTSDMLKGHVAVLDFWATWCGPCMHEMPHMLKIYKAVQPRGVIFLGFSFDTSHADLNKIVAKYHIPWPQYFDGKGWKNNFAGPWGIQFIPQSFILSPDGVLLWRGNVAQIEKPLAAAIQKYPYHPPVHHEQAKPHPHKTAHAATQPAPDAAAVNARLVRNKAAYAAVYEKAGKKFEAYDMYAWIVQHAPKSDEAKTAKAKIAAYQQDKAFMAKLKQHQAEVAAMDQLDLANNYLAAGRTNLAAAGYQKILDTWPQTPAADQARQALVKLPQAERNDTD